MADALTFTIRGGDYDHVRDLSTDASGIGLCYAPVHVTDLFVRMLTMRSEEVCEFSLANYLILRGTGGDWLTALPVFPHRVFRHSMVTTRRDSPLNDLRSLSGTRVGVPDYSMTAAVWVRGLLRAEYGVDHRTITWVTPRKQRFAIPSHARIEFTDENLETLLEQGAIDASLAPAPRDAALPARERKLRTVLPDAEAAERDYLRRTGIYPIMHCVVIRNDALARAPHLGDAVANAYAKAKARAYARRSASVLPWGGSRWDEDMALFAGDPLPYGMNAVNRKVVATLANDLHEQGFIPARANLGALFLAPAL